MKPTSTNRYVSTLSCLQYAYTEALDGHLIATSFGVASVGAVVFAILGPMGMEENLGVVQRFVLVGLCCALCWPLCHGLSASILYLMRKRPPLQIALACAVGALFMAIPFSFTAVAIYGLFDPSVAIRDSLSEVYLNVAVLLFACSAPIYYVACHRAKLREAGVPQKDRAATRVPQPPPLTDGNVELRDRFFDRLPDAVGHDVVYLGVSGHYVQVVTAAGSCLILMRLADAVRALGDLGMQVHRSYWVARRHVVGTVSRDDRMLVRVTGQHEVPVSRTYIANVRAAVWPAREKRSAVPLEGGPPASSSRV